MAVLTAGNFPLDMGDLGMAMVTEPPGAYVDPAFLFIQFTLSDGSIQTYHFATPVFNGEQIVGGTIIYRFEALTSGWTPIVTIDQMSISINTHDAYAAKANATGLLGYIFRGHDVLNGSIYPDVLRGFAGNDTYLVTAGDIIVEAAGGGTDTAESYESVVLGANVENLTLLGGAALEGTGNSLANVIAGNAGDNVLSGMAGNDRFEFGGNAGSTFDAGDLIDGGTGTDEIRLYAYVATSLTDADFANVRSVETLTLMAGYESASLLLGSHSEVAGLSRVDGSGVMFDDWQPITIDASERTLAISITGSVLGDTLKGGAGRDSISGGQGNDTISGGAGADSLAGGSGDDTYYAGTGDVITEAVRSGFDIVYSDDSFGLAANLENLTLTGSAHVDATGNGGVNVLIGNSGNNRINGGAGADTMVGGGGDDTYFMDNALDQIVEESGGGNDTVQTSVANLAGSAFSIEGLAELENITLAGKVLTAVGHAGSNTLTGNALANTLDGKAGADILVGLAGNDIYFVDDAQDVVTEALNGGGDTIKSSVSFALAPNVEALLLLPGFGNIDATGNALANTLTGNEGNNRLDGGAGADAMTGGLGDDTYVVDNARDVVKETANAGLNDTIESSISLTLGLNVEHLTLTGAARINATGNTLANTLTGNSGNNILNGLTGTDTLIGGLGDDTFILELTGDVVVEEAGGGADTVQIGRSVDLTAEFDNVENVTLTIAGAFNLTGDEADNILKGNASANILIGNAGDDRLEGGLGADTLNGGEGDDTYVLNGADIIETDSGGNDTVEVAAHYLNLRADLENVTLLGTAAYMANGNASANVLKGNSGANVLDGKAGVDTLIGGAGNDTYFVDDTADVVTENASAGTDKVNSGATYVLGANIEVLALTGDQDIDGTGNALNNTITGNAGKNRLDGGTGNDALAGGLGDDVYVVDSTLDRITENLNAGEDTVESWVSYALATNVDRLQLMGTALNATGNALANELTGNDADNVLDGKAGADFLAGGLGDDLYVIDHAGDVVSEHDDEGNDTVRVAYAATTVPALILGVGILAHVENLEAIGTGAFSFTGNEADNKLTGNASANILSGGEGKDTLDGKAGADTLAGGDGDDLYRVDNSLDNVIEVAGEGEDTVESTATYRLDTRPDVEHLILLGAAAISATGNALANTLTGNNAANTLTGLAGDDSLDGLGGNDVLIGGPGDDTYYVNAARDVIRENAGEGTDVVFSAVSYTLALNVEELTLTGSANLIAIGNAGDNVLIGNAGNNLLDGKAGVDTLVGGSGNDIYIVDHNADHVEEEVGAGIDLVQSSASDHELADNVENLTLVGSAAINGAGNGLDNVLTGNAAVNILFGGEGDDTLNGAAGADILVGNAGNDTYFVDNLNDAVTESEDEGIDLVQSTIVYTLPANVEHATLLGRAAIGLTGNELENILTGNTGANMLNGADGNDTLVGGAGNDTLNGGEGNDELNGGAGLDTMRGNEGDDLYRVDSVSDKVLENFDEGDDTIRSTVSITALAANVENLILEGAALAGVGNAADNGIAGNGNNNTLNGGLGNDTLAGGLGNDTYVVDSVNDVVVEMENEGIDTVQTTATVILAANVEKGVLLGTAGIAVSGNALANTLTGNAGSNGLFGLDGNDILVGNAGNDVLDGGIGNDTMQGGIGNDTYHVDAAGDVVTELANSGTDTVLSSITYQLGANAENLVLAAGAGSTNGTGNALANAITGNESGNVLDGGAGNDSLDGAAGDDVLLGQAGNDDLTGGSGNDALDGGTGIDRMAGGEGDDQYAVDAVSDSIVELADGGTDRVTAILPTGATYVLGANVENLLLAGASASNGIGNASDNIMAGNAGNNQLSGAGGNDLLDGGDGNDILKGDSGSDFLTGSGGDDTLLGGDGDDKLDGGAGNDLMDGGAGNDDYFLDGSDTLIETENSGVDTVHAHITYTLAANFEHLVLEGSAAINGTGNAGDNRITGNEADNELRGEGGNDTLDGGAGIDTLLGGMGDDTYRISTPGHILIENANEGVDLVEASIAHALGANFENLILSGTGNLDGIGNAGVNTITGNSGDNRLDGGAGADTLIGLEGDDAYVVDDAGDDVMEGASQGIDTVRTSVNYAMPDNVEVMILTAAGLAVAGNSLDNTISLDGSIAELPAGASISGGEGNDSISGGAGDDVFDFEGNGGADSMTGGAGNDVYHVGHNGDVINEELGGGNADTVIVHATFSGAYALAANVERAALADDALEGREITGNALDNWLAGGAGADLLRGEAGNDWLDGEDGIDNLYGGVGDDTYLLADADFVHEESGEGTDTIRTSFDIHLLAANVERLEGLSEGGQVLKGNDLDNQIFGNSGADFLYGLDGNDLLEGGAGGDTLYGGAGDDTYVVVEGAEDSIFENAFEGSDTVQFRSTALNSIYVLNAPNVENVTLLDGAGGEDAVGNGMDNVLTGNSDNNILSGGAGNDTLDGGGGIDKLHGGAGDDLYIIGNRMSLDGWFTLAGDAGEPVTGGQNLAFSNAEGAFSVVILTDFSGNEGLMDTVRIRYSSGGAEYTFFFSTSGLEGGVSLEPGTYASAEVPFPVGVPGLRITGNGVTPDQIDGSFTIHEFDVDYGSGVPVLRQLSASFEQQIPDAAGPTLTGHIEYKKAYGASQDVVELEDEGIDTVQSGLNFNLPDNVENLVFTGEADLDGMGNALANEMGGNTGDNWLQGMAGDDILTGGAGSDALDGGSGNDRLDGGQGADIMLGGDGDDVFIFDADDTVLEGQAGNDTLKLSGAGQTMNFNQIIPSGIYDSFEIIDLTGTGDNSLVLSFNQMLALSTSTNILKVIGDSGDTVTTTGWGSFTVDSALENGITYTTYNWGGNYDLALWTAQGVDVLIS